VTALGFVQVLAAAGIIGEDIDRVSKITITATPRDLVTIDVTYIADERIVDLVGAWTDVRQNYDDMLVGRAIREGQDSDGSWLKPE
jgi:hypothetical protein